MNIMHRRFLIRHISVVDGTKLEFLIGAPEMALLSAKQKQPLRTLNDPSATKLESYSTDHGHILNGDVLIIS